MNRRDFIRISGYGSIAGLGILSKSSRCEMALRHGGDQSVLTQPVKEIHQILLLDGMALPERISPILAERTAVLQRMYPGAKYHLWGGEALRSFIAEHFGAETLHAFDGLKPYSYKSDLGRYCLLYQLGGLYSDMSLLHEKPWRIPQGCGYAAFIDRYRKKSLFEHSIGNSLLWAEPKRREFSLAIERIIKNCKEKFYGASWLEPTGPWLLGHAYACVASDNWRAGVTPDQWFGAILGDDPSGAKFTSFLEEEPTMVANRGNRLGGDWTSFGHAGVNNYRDMWFARDVY